MRDGDHWLIASDGLTSYVPHDLIERELASVHRSRFITALFRPSISMVPLTQSSKYADLS
jgi:hypothetical protein